MAKLCKCDKCGKSCTGLEVKTTIHTFDLCQDCYDKLLDWFSDGVLLHDALKEVENGEGAY